MNSNVYNAVKTNTCNYYGCCHWLNQATDYKLYLI